jgi:hypothetical protein
MANEIAISLTINNSALSVNKSISYRGDQTEQNRVALTKTCGTSEETFSPDADLTTTGFCIMQNKDPTNYVSWGFTTGQLHGRLRPGDPPTLIFLNSTSADIITQANTAACDVDIEVWGV